MIKKCKVVTENKHVIVFDFDGILIQTSSLKSDNGYIYVSYFNGKYKVVSKNDYEKSLIKTRKNNKTGLAKKTGDTCE